MADKFETTGERAMREVREASERINVMEKNQAVIAARLELVARTIRGLSPLSHDEFDRQWTEAEG